jgi:uncharacterized protein (DUF2147 family)
MKVSLIAAMMALAPAVAHAGPAGKWRVGDGTAVVSIRQCGAGLCGSIAATSDGGGTDENNQNPALRGRKLVGLPILSLAPAGDNLWSGNVYNAQNGQNYSARMSMKGDAVLTLEGCAPGTNLCGEDQWTRAR